MRRFLVAMMLGTIFGTVSFAAASSLDVEGQVLQTGDTPESALRCQDEPLDVELIPFEDGEEGPLGEETPIASVDISGIDPECNDAEDGPLNKLGVVLLDEDGLPLLVNGDVARGQNNLVGTQTEVSLDDRPPLKDVYGVRVLIVDKPEDADPFAE